MDCIVELDWGSDNNTNFSCPAIPEPADSCIESVCPGTNETCNVTAHLEEQRINRTDSDPAGLCFTIVRTLTAADDCFSPPVSQTRTLFARDDSPPFFLNFPNTTEETVQCNLTDPLNLTVGDLCTPAELLEQYMTEEVLRDDREFLVVRRTYGVRDDCGLFHERNRTITVDRFGPTCGMSLSALLVPLCSRFRRCRGLQPHPRCVLHHHGAAAPQQHEQRNHCVPLRGPHTV